jgi:hypothetical protein
MSNVKVPRAGTPPEIRVTTRIASATKHLSSLSADIKTASNELCASLGPLENALAKFDLGVSAWFKITGNSRDDGSYWSREIGYAQIGKKWGIALKKTEGHEAAEYDEVENWLFKDAPMWMQIEAIPKIPDLLEALSKRVEETIVKLKDKAVQAKELTDALEAALAEVVIEESTW